MSAAVRGARWNPSALFVGSGSVDGRQWHVVQAQVHRELAAVVDQVIQENAPQQKFLLQGKEDLASSRDGEVARKVLLGNGGDRLAGFPDVLIEPGEEVRGALH